MCNADSETDIDYDDPRISLEYLLCDVRITNLLMRGKREVVLKKMTYVQQ